MSSHVTFLFFIPFIAIVLLAINLIFAPHNPYQEKNGAFECGFSSFLGQNRTQFSVSFFIFALLFLLFDLEILLVYPYLVSAYTNEIYGLAIMLVFLLALTLGFAFELGKKALSIDSRQMFNTVTNSNTTLSPITPTIVSSMTGVIPDLLDSINEIPSHELTDRWLSKGSENDPTNFFDKGCFDAWNRLLKILTTDLPNLPNTDAVKALDQACYDSKDRLV